MKGINYKGRRIKLNTLIIGYLKLVFKLMNLIFPQISH